MSTATPGTDTLSSPRSKAVRRSWRRRVGQHLRDAADELPHDRAEEPVTHDHVGSPVHQLVALDVADEVERGQLAQPAMGLDQRLVPLRVLVPHVEEADAWARRL